MNDYKVSRSSATDSKAIASLIFGILSIIFIFKPYSGIIIGIVGLFLGIIRLGEIKRSAQEGKKLVVSGIACSGLGILLQIILAIIDL